jgi:hypothetical protein
MSQNKQFTQQEAYELLNKVYKVIIKPGNYQFKNTGKNIDLSANKDFYDGFYAAFNFLIKLPDLPKIIEYDIIYKKSQVDQKYLINITNKNQVHHKTVANNITNTMANTIAESIKSNNKAKILSDLAALQLKKKVVPELNNSENKRLNELLEKKSYDNIAAKFKELNLFKKP